MANDPFKALGHPVRRKIVERLAAGPATVGEATRGFGIAKPTISRHLKVLEEAGLLVRVIDGRSHRLEVRAEPLDDASDWLDRQRHRWEGVLDALEEHVAEKRAAKR